MTWGTGYSSIIAGKGANPGARIPLEILPIGTISSITPCMSGIIGLGGLLITWERRRFPGGCVCVRLWLCLCAKLHVLTA
jgi:hypothetical protein